MGRYGSLVGINARVLEKCSVKMKSGSLSCQEAHFLDLDLGWS
jgi:hypothetical protein